MAKLLLVEDEQVNRDLFRRRLERKGYTVIPAENGLNAVALAISEIPDLVIMDLGLPDIDGWEATKRIKVNAATAEIPVIVLSAHVTSDAKEKAFLSGCQDFETKPVNWDVLFGKIEEWLRKAKEQRAAKEPVDPAATGVISTKQMTRTTSAAPLPEPKRILVVEDDEPNRAMLCRRLNKFGHATTEAANGREALVAVSQENFDLILCDIVMPELDGYETLRQLKANSKTATIPVIMISGIEDMASVTRCIEAGAEDYLTKPYDPLILQSRVHAFLDTRRLRELETMYQRSLAALTQAIADLELGQYDSQSLTSLVNRSDALGSLARAIDRYAKRPAQAGGAPHGLSMSDTMLLPKRPPA